MSHSSDRKILRIIVRGENIAIAGGRPCGTLYGVYTFLEDYLGVRFLTADNTHVPAVGNWRKVGADRWVLSPAARFPLGRLRGQLSIIRNSLRAMRQNVARLPACPVDGSDWSNAGKFGGRSSMEEMGYSFNQLVPPETYAEA